MRIVTADGRSVAVGGGSLAGALAPPSLGGSARIRTLPGRDGLRRSVRFAEVARANPWVRASVNARVSVASRVPIHVFLPTTTTINGKMRHYRERVRTGTTQPGANLAELMIRPGSRISGRRWRRRLLSDVLVHGNGLFEDETVRGQLVGLAWQPWVDVQPHATSDALGLEAFEVPIERRTGLATWGTYAGRPRGETRMIDRDDAVHLVIDDDLEVREGPLGVSPLAALHYTHALHDAAMRFALSYLDNGTFPTGAVELEKGATPELARATRELLQAVHAGVERSGAPLALAGKWTQISATPDGAKLIELAKFSREEVAAAYGLTLQQLGDMGNSNRATATVGRESFIRDTVGSDVAVFESEVNAQLIPRHAALANAGVFVEGQLAEQLRPDLEARSRIHQRSGRWMSGNEVRDVEGYAPSEDPRADELIFDPGTPPADDEPNPDDDADDL